MAYPTDKVVYIHRRAIDGVVFYIGMGSAKRARSRQCRSAQWRAVADVSGFTCEIVQSGLTIRDALALEIATIAQYDLQSLTNLNPGGGGCQRHTDETKRKQRENCSTKRPEVKAKIAAAQRGKKRPGLFISPVALEALRRAQQARIGSRHSAETVARISASNKGRKKRPEEAVNISEGRRDKTVYRFWHEARGLVLADRKAAQEMIGASKSGISRIVIGQREQIYGWQCLGTHAA